MPYPFVKRLQVSKREKIGLTGIFLLGWLSVAASCVFLSFVVQAYLQVYGHTSLATKRQAGTDPALWVMVSISVQIIAACLPSLGPLMRKLFPASASMAVYQRSRQRTVLRQASDSTFASSEKVRLTVPAEVHVLRTCPRSARYPRRIGCNGIDVV